MQVNCDDDDHNGVPDDQQSGPFAAENNLVAATLSWTAGCAQMAAEGNQVIWRIEEGSGNRTYHVWRNPDKTGPIDSQSDYNPWPPPSAVWIEGIGDAGTCPSRIVMWVGTFDNLHCIYCGYEGQPMNVHGPALEWEKAASSNADIDDCPNNGGKRIFPDLLNPNDNPTPASLRQQVDIVAKVDPPAPRATVYFRVFDVDDPFDQIHGPQGLNDIENVSSIDGDASGPDNRPTSEGPWPGSWGAPGTTSPDGKEAYITFTVSMQPGNNYRAVASQSWDAINLVTQTEADAMNQANPQSPGSVRGCNAPLIWSPMLTVWRRLTLEVDSMEAESFVQGDRESNGLEWARFVVAQTAPTIPQPVQPNVPDAGLTTLLGSLIPLGAPCSTSYDNRWEGGSFALASGGAVEHMIVRNSCYATTDGQSLTKVIVWGDPGNVQGLTFNLRDDDLCITGSGPRQLPKLSVLTDEVRHAYQDAYLDIREANNEINQRQSIAWQSNLDWTALNFDYTWGVGVAGTRDIASSQTFWDRHILMCYQPTKAYDLDPDGFENAAPSMNLLRQSQAPYPNQHLTNLNATMDSGSDYGVTVSLPLADAFTTIYVETIRDRNIDPTSPKLWQFIAHEVGHKTEPRISEFSEDQEHAEGGLMTEGNNLQDSPGYRRFTAPTILRMRGVDSW